MPASSVGELLALILGTLALFWVAGGVISVIGATVDWVWARLVAWFGPLWPTPPHWSRKGPSRPSNPGGIPGDSQN